MKRFKRVHFSTFHTAQDCINDMHNNPDVVVLDYHLAANDSKEKLNGIDVLKKIKRLSRNVQVIILSGQDKVEVSAKAIKAGAHDYVAKGENTIIRLHNIIRKAAFNVEHIQENTTYIKRNYILSGVALLLLVIDIIYYFIHK